MPAGRPRKINPGENWVRVTISLSPEEAEELDRLRGDKAVTTFFRLAMQAYKLRRKDYEIRLRKGKKDKS